MYLKCLLQSDGSRYRFRYHVIRYAAYYQYSGIMSVNIKGELSFYVFKWLFVVQDLLKTIKKD